MISDEAVEAAARAMAPAVWGPSVWQFAAHGETPTAARDRVQQESLQDARRALEAAAPHMLADAASRPDTQQIGTLPAEYQPNKPYSPNTADVITTNPYRSRA